MSEKNKKINLEIAEQHLKLDPETKETFETWFDNLFISDGNLTEQMVNIVRNESLDNPQNFYSLLLIAFDYDIKIFSHFKEEINDKISTALWEEISKRDDLFDIASDFLNSIQHTPIVKNFTEMIVLPFVEFHKKNDTTQSVNIQECFSENMPTFAPKHIYYEKCKAEQQHLNMVINITTKNNKNSNLENKNYKL